MSSSASQGLVIESDGEEREESTSHGRSNNSRSSVNVHCAAAAGVKNIESLEGAMVEIVESPYEEGGNAELGEDCFEELKILMTPVLSEDGQMGIHEEMEFYFADKLALSVSKAYQEIGKEENCYLTSWVGGKIGGTDCGWVPNRHLLLCLHGERLAAASEATLRMIVRDLDCTKYVLQAMKEWKLEAKYMNLSSCKSFFFESNKARCYKCEIFVARAFVAFDVLIKTHSVTNSMAAKIDACLSIMNEHVRVNPQRLAKRKLELESKKEKVVAGQKKTGQEDLVHPVPAQRPLKEISVTINSEEEDGSASAVTTDLLVSANPTSQRRSVQTPEERVQTLQMLYDIVREQHDRLGQTIALFQDSVEEHQRLSREELREEVRAELMQEMRNGGNTATIMKTRKRRRGSK